MGHSYGTKGWHLFYRNELNGVEKAGFGASIVRHSARYESPIHFEVQFLFRFYFGRVRDIEMQRHEEGKAKTTKDTKVARRLFQRILRVALMSFVILICYDALEMR